MNVDVRNDGRWAELTGNVASDVFHSPRWANVLHDAYGFNTRANMVMNEDERPVAGMAYVDIDDLRGRRVVSLPFSDFCDPLVFEPSHWKLLSDELATLDVPVSMRCLRFRGTTGDIWRETASFAWHRADVRRPPDQIWAALHPSARRAVRKAESLGLEVDDSSTEADLRAFFDMHLQIRKHKYGLLAQPYRFFEAIWEHFLKDGHGHLMLARAGSEVVGGILYLRWGDTLYYKFNASSRHRLDVRPNDLLLWEGLRLAHGQGLRWLDFGVSDLDQEGLIRYKRKYATEEGAVQKLATGPSLIDHLGPLLGQVTALLADPSVPDSVTESAGDRFYPLFC